jgi:transposase
VSAPIGAESICLAVLGGSTITLMTRMQHGTQSDVAKIAAAFAGGFLLAGLQLFHSILDSLLIFGAIHAGAPVGYGDWLRWFAYTVVFNILGGLVLVTALRLGRVPQMLERRVSQHVGVHDRHDLTDDQWELIEPHLPLPAAGKAGRPWADHRRVVNAVLWRTRSGAAWRDVPHAYGAWKTVYNRHRRWAGDGTWERLLSELQRGSDVGLASWDVGIDSTVVRAHQHAAGAPRTPPNDVPVERLVVALEDYVSSRARPRTGHTGGSAELQEAVGN